MKISKYLLIVLLLLANLKGFSQNKNTENDTISYSDTIRQEVVFDSNDPDEALYAMQNIFKNQKIATEILNIKRDRNNKIIAIEIKMKSDDGRIKELNINKIKPIKAIKIYVDKTNNPDWDFGIEELIEEVHYSK